jgi:hypothetical protein
MNSRKGFSNITLVIAQEISNVAANKTDFLRGGSVSPTTRAEVGREAISCLLT